MKSRIHLVTHPVGLARRECAVERANHEADEHVLMIG
jgi:hypothetical protein